MREDRVRGLVVGQPGHPLHRHGALLEMHHEVADLGDDLGQYADVDDEHGEVADGERTRREAVGRRQQDQTGTQRGRVPEERVEGLAEQPIADRRVQPSLVQLLHMGEHVLLSARQLDRLDPFHRLTDRSGNLLGRPATRFAEAPDVLADQSGCGDHREQREHDDGRDPCIDRDQDDQCDGGVGNERHLIDHPTHRVLDDLDVVTHRVECLAGRAVQRLRAGSGENGSQQIASHQRAHVVAMSDVDQRAREDRQDSGDATSGHQGDDAPNRQPDRRAVRERVEEQLRDVAGTELGQQNGDPSGDVGGVQTGAVLHQLPQRMTHLHTSTSSSPACSSRLRREFGSATKSVRSPNSAIRPSSRIRT